MFGTRGGDTTQDAKAHLHPLAQVASQGARHGNDRVAWIKPCPVYFIEALYKKTNGKEVKWAAANSRPLRARATHPAESLPFVEGRHDSAGPFVEFCFVEWAQ